MSHIALQEEWNQLYRVRLPALAKKRDPCQQQWPVTLDHCFARIVLDNAIGKDRPWGDILKAPAIKNMSEQQLLNAIDLGQQIVSGDKNLVELDQRSLVLRGKTRGSARGIKRSLEIVHAGKDEAAGETTRKKTNKGEMADTWERFSASETDQSSKQHLLAPPAASQPSSNESPDSSLEAIRARINEDKTSTPFRRRVLLLLTQIPRGRYSTYKAMAAAVTATQSDTTAKSSARAVGSAMRNNPFAPMVGWKSRGQLMKENHTLTSSQKQVPCHRILAANGKIGGFGGDWGDEGRFANEKRRLLREEGVKFDGHGTVVGSPFTAFR